MSNTTPTEPASLPPIFFALRTAYFRAFERGEQSFELRRYGRRFNERVCLPGRRVILGHGYSGRGRLSATIVAFERRTMDTETFGPQQDIAIIHLRLDDAATPKTENPDATPPSLPR